MKKIIILITVVTLLICLCSCSKNAEHFDIVATTLPVYEFTTRLCSGTDLSVGKLIAENVSCLHDYTLQVQQMRILEDADTIVISGAGFESFLDDILSDHITIDASANISLLGCSVDHEEAHEHEHEYDPHIWLSPSNAKAMATNIYNGLTLKYPQHKAIFEKNLDALQIELDELVTYASVQLESLSNKEMITFHDGFQYMADALGLTIIHTVEEESGSEASAAELIELINLVNNNNLPAIFIEKNGSDSAAKIISRETGIKIYTLDMAVAGNSYFDAMYHNIDTLKEALE